MLVKALFRFRVSRDPIATFRISKSTFLQSSALIFEVNLKRTIMSGEKEASSGLPLKDIVSKLNSFANLSLAEKWDNVGLLIEPYTETLVKNILLTNDLTEAVMKEAIDKKINLIISYHPPIFSALKRITRATWKERLVGACLENRIAVFSPHTSWDAVNGGVNDWLADAFDGYIQSEGRSSLTSVDIDPLYIVLIAGCSTSINQALKEFGVTKILERSKQENEDSCIIMCSKSVLNNLKKIKGISIGSITCEKNQKDICGMGRMLQVKGLNIATCVKLIKQQVGLPFVRLALAKDKSEDSEIETIALCAGSGGSLLKGVNADLFVTGEMFHHDVLDANHNGTSVILTNHSDSERGFLKVMEKTLQDTLKNSVNIIISNLDSDPLKTV